MRYVRNKKSLTLVRSFCRLFTDLKLCRPLLDSLLEPLANMLRESGLKATDIKAGCAKCGACSALSTYERALLS